MGLVAQVGVKARWICVARRSRYAVGVIELVNFEDHARTRLLRLDAAQSLADLAALPGNRLEALAGDRVGQHSIRINDQFRICFRWDEKGAHDVEIVDYH